MNRQRFYILLLLLLANVSGYAQKQHKFSFDSLFAKYPESFDSIISHKDDYRLQVLYTRIDRDINNVSHLTTYNFDADKYYYYCASMMKLPACALTLEKLNSLSKYHVNMLDSVSIDTLPCTDLTTESMMQGTPYSCLSQYIKEMLLVSNNNAFNPVYDFLGQHDFQERLHDIGCRSAVVSNRYAGCDTDQNRRCDPVSLFDRKTHQLKYSQPCITNQRRQFYDGELSPLVGTGYLGGGTLINQPKSFQFANYIKLSELHRLLTRIILPETQAPAEKLNLRHSDYQYLYKCMGMFPRECAYPAFDSIHYPDHYMKYFMSLDSGSRTMPDNIRIFNKVGQAYGFMTDCSYVVDTLNKVEFFLSCSMYLNADGILNDGKYEYDQIGYPFFHNLFNAVYSEELMRTKKILPMLTLPDFTDTLLVKPVVKPLWLKVDSTKTMAEMEGALCGLIDHYSSSMKNDKDSTFIKNLSIVLRQPSAVYYPFDSLKKNILILTSPDSLFRVFSWDFPFVIGKTEGQVIVYKGKRGKPAMILDHYKILEATYDLSHYNLGALHQVKSGKSKTYYLLENTDGRLHAYSIKDGTLWNEKIFKISKNTSVDEISVQARWRELTDKKGMKIIKVGIAGKRRSQIQYLKFDGTVFR